MQERGNDDPFDFSNNVLINAEEKTLKNDNFAKIASADNMEIDIPVGRSTIKANFRESRCFFYNHKTQKRDCDCHRHENHDNHFYDHGSGHDDHDNHLQGPWTFGYDHWGDDWADWDHNHHNFENLKHEEHVPHDNGCDHGGRNCIPTENRYYYAPVINDHHLVLPCQPRLYNGYCNGAYRNNFLCGLYNPRPHY